MNVHGNWDWGRAVPRKLIYKWHFSCSADSPALCLSETHWVTKFSHIIVYPDSEAHVPKVCPFISEHPPRWESLMQVVLFAFLLKSLAGKSSELTSNALQFQGRMKKCPSGRKFGRRTIKGQNTFGKNFPKILINTVKKLYQGSKVGPFRPNVSAKPAWKMW